MAKGTARPVQCKGVDAAAGALNKTPEVILMAARCRTLYYFTMVLFYRSLKTIKMLRCIFAKKMCIFESHVVGLYIYLYASLFVRA